MALDIGTLVAKVKVDDGDFDNKTKGWTTKGAAIGSAFGNVAANAISQATSMLVDFVGGAVEASDATDKFKKTLAFAGLDDSKISGLTKSTQEYADKTVYSLTDIQSITAQLASNGVKNFDVLAESLGNLNAVAGGNAETYGRVGMVLTQTAGAGKLTTENWNQLAEAIPGASGPLQAALLKAGAYTGNFRDAMAKGQITSEEFNAALMKVGSDPIAVEAAKSVSTFEGAQGNLAAAIQSQLVAALDTLKPAFTAIVNGIAWFVSNIGQFTPLLAGLGAIILAVLAPSLWAAVVATAAWTVALLANPITWIVLGIGLLVAAIVWLVQNWDTATKFVTDVWQGFLTWFTSVVDGFVQWWNGVWSAVSKWFQGVIAAVVAFVQSHWGLLLSFLIGPIGLAIQWIVEHWSQIVAWFQGAIAGFIAFWAGVWNQVKSTTVSIWTGIITWFRNIPGAIRDIFVGAATWLYNIGRDIINGLWNGLKSIWSSVSGWFQDTFGGIIDTVAGIFQINSPSRVFMHIGESVGEGMIKGLNKNDRAVDQAFRSLMSIPPNSTPTAAGTATYTPASKTLNYYAAEHQSLSAEEALFAAIGSPRAKGDW